MKTHHTSGLNNAWRNQAWFQKLYVNMHTLSNIYFIKNKQKIPSYFNAIKKKCTYEVKK